MSRGTASKIEASEISRIGETTGRIEAKVDGSSLSGFSTIFFRSSSGAPTVSRSGIRIYPQSGVAPFALPAQGSKYTLTRFDFDLRDESSEHRTLTFSGAGDRTLTVRNISGSIRVSGSTDPAVQLDVQRINLREPDGTLRMVMSSAGRSPGIYVKGKEFPHPMGRKDAGFLFHAPDNVKAEFPQFPAVDDYDELLALITAELT